MSHLNSDILRCLDMSNLTKTSLYVDVFAGIYFRKTIRAYFGRESLVILVKQKILHLRRMRRNIYTL